MISTEQEPMSRSMKNLHMTSLAIYDKVTIPIRIAPNRYKQRHQSWCSTFVPFLAVLTVQIVKKTSDCLVYLMSKVMEVI